MNEIKIGRYPLAIMVAGDSFLIPRAETPPARARSEIFIWARNHGQKGCWATRMEEGGLRVFKIADCPYDGQSPEGKVYRYQIDKGIVLRPAFQTASTKYPYRTVEIGESFRVSCGTYASARPLLRQWEANSGRTFSIVREGNEWVITRLS